MFKASLTLTPSMAPKWLQARSAIALHAGRSNRTLERQIYFAFDVFASCSSRACRKRSVLSARFSASSCTISRAALVERSILVSARVFFSSVGFVVLGLAKIEAP